MQRGEVEAQLGGWNVDLFVLGAVFGKLEELLDSSFLFGHSSLHFGQLLDIVPEFAPQVGVGLDALVAMVHGFDAGFEPKRDQQTGSDGEQMNEEITNSKDRMARCVNVQH